MHDLSFTQTFSQGDGIKKAHLPNVYLSAPGPASSYWEKCHFS